MKTYQIKMSRSRWFSLLLAVLMIVMIVELCTPYFTYGKQTLSFVPPEGGNEKILNGTWKLSGSDETQDGYKEIVINSGKMTVKTTNIIRVNQLTADEAVKTAKADYEKIAANVKAADIAVQKAEALELEGEKVFNMIAKKLGFGETADEIEKAEEQAAAAASATPVEGEAAVEEKPVEEKPSDEKPKQMTDAETSLKKMIKAVKDAKDNLAKAQEALVIAQEAVTAARNGAVKTYEADASYAWITETEEAYNNAVDEAFKADYISGNTDRVRSELIAAAESKELDALKKTKKAELKAEGITDSKAVDKALNEVAVSAEKKNEIASSITDDAVAAEVEKQYADYIANMLGEKKDGALNAKLNANKALAAEGAKAAAEAMDKAEAAAKEKEKRGKACCCAVFQIAFKEEIYAEQHKRVCVHGGEHRCKSQIGAERIEGRADAVRQKRIPDRRVRTDGIHRWERMLLSNAGDKAEVHRKVAVGRLPDRQTAVDRQDRMRGKKNNADHKQGKKCKQYVAFREPVVFHDGLVFCEDRAERSETDRDGKREQLRQQREPEQKGKQCRKPNQQEQRDHAAEPETYKRTLFGKIDARDRNAR